MFTAGNDLRRLVFPRSIEEGNANHVWKRKAFLLGEELPAINPPISPLSVG
jgi:hypothetical protein